MAESTTEKSRDQQINDLATRVAQEIKATKALVPDTSTLVPKAGDRGVLGGYQTVVDGHMVYPDYIYEYITMDDTPNSATTGGNVFISKGTEGTTFVKIIALAGSPQVQIVGSTDEDKNCIKWVDGEAPEITVGVLIYLWFENKGYLQFIPFPS